MTSGKRLLAKVAPYAVIARGIAHPHRLAILYLVSHEPMSPQDMARHIPIPQNLIAHHLHTMIASGWLKKRRVGKNVVYAIHKPTIRQLSKLLLGTPFWSDVIKSK